MASPEPGFYDTSEYLIGTLSVELIFVESDGSFDSNSETWTASERTSVENEVLTGLNWWAGNPLGPGLNGTLHSDLVTTQYEPILRPQSDEGLWISEVMGKFGYSTGDYFHKTRSFVNDMRAADGFDWGWVIFVVDSSNDADGKFSDDHFAYAYLGGPFMVMTYDNDGWGIGDMDRITAHETGHIFYATDEYDGVPTYSGYLNSLEVEDSGCIMDDNTFAISTGTMDQIGWRDSNGDGVLDIVNTPPDVSMSPYSPDPTNATIIDYSGTTSITPYPNHNPIGPGNDITISRISTVEYSLDGSGWVAASATDGSWDSSVEDFQFSLVPTEGNHEVEVRARTTQGVNSTDHTHDDFTIDRTPPDSMISSAPVITNSAQFDVQANATDSVGVSHVELWYSHNGGSYALYSTKYAQPWQWQFNTSTTGGEGTYSFFTKSEDLAGNAESIPSTPDANTAVDLTKPTSSVQLTPAYTNSSTVSIAALAADNLGIASVELWYRSMKSGWTLFQTLDSPPWTWVFNSSGIDGDSRYEFYSRAIDIAGNYEDSPAVDDTLVMIDTMPPTTGWNISNPIGVDGWYPKASNLTLRAFDQMSGVSSTLYRLDSADWTDYSGMIELTDGIHVVDFYAIDNVGNSGSYEHLTIKVDGTVPLISLLTQGGKRTDSLITVAWTASDAISGIDRFEVTVDGLETYLIEGGQTSLDFVLPDGDHVIVVRAYDLGGNHAEATLVLTVDTNLLSIEGPAGPWFLIVITVIAAAAILIGLALLRRRKDDKGDKQNLLPPTPPLT